MVIKNFNKLKKQSNKDKIFYKKTYSMKNITHNFIKSNLINIFNEF